MENLYRIYTHDLEKGIYNEKITEKARKGKSACKVTTITITTQASENKETQHQYGYNKTAGQ
ncbi:MAG: hypothetical protein PHE06_00665 [Lachnospiraceae bacterium]|nr:hypothetical protein [Lachnospiraceae bacterium]MDD3794478.1 hypothetical protein [Lachnospiraceae bacterium]